MIEIGGGGEMLTRGGGGMTYKLDFWDRGGVGKVKPCLRSMVITQA